MPNDEPTKERVESLPRVENVWVSPVGLVCGPPIEPIRQGGIPPVEPVGLPRRFGVGTLLIITTLYAVLFAVMKSLNTPPEGFVVVALFFTGVGVSRAVLYGGKKPRKASVVAGAWLAPLLGFGAAIADVLRTFDKASEAAGIVCMLVPAAIPLAGFGALCGYLAGALAAGVFLWIERDPRRDNAKQLVADEEAQLAPANSVISGPESSPSVNLNE